MSCADLQIIWCHFHSNASAVRGSNLWVFMVQPLHRSQRGDKHRRLAVHRLLQVLLGPVQTQRQEVVAEDPLGDGEHVSDVGILQKSSRHAHKLAALTGEQEHGAAAGVLSEPPLLGDR